MWPKRLRNLAILSTEHSIAQNLKFDVIVNGFAEQKAQKNIIFNNQLKFWLKI